MVIKEIDGLQMKKLLKKKVFLIIIIMSCLSISMDRIVPSEGTDKGSIPFLDTIIITNYCSYFFYVIIVI